MRDLLRLIAFQLGSEVSYDELGKQLSMSKTTVEKYLDLLEKVFVIYRLGAYSRNLRKEVTKAGKWYFYDNGIRNAIIGAFHHWLFGRMLVHCGRTISSESVVRRISTKGCIRSSIFGVLTINKRLILSKRILII